MIIACEWTVLRVLASGHLCGRFSRRGGGPHGRCREMARFRSNQALQLTATAPRPETLSMINLLPTPIRLASSSRS
jgi:hypothetical protein